MPKLFINAALTFGLLLTGPAIAAPTQTLTHQGVTYEYTVTEKGHTRIIKGIDRTNKRPFRLRVASGRVEGSVDGNPVSFPLRDVKPIVTTATATATASTEIAVR